MGSSLFEESGVAECFGSIVRSLPYHGSATATTVWIWDGAAPGRVVFIKFPLHVTDIVVEHTENFEITNAGDTNKAGAGAQQLLRRWNDSSRHCPAR